MRDFQAGPPARLRALPVGGKLLYSAYVVATLVGLVLSWRLYGAVVGDAGPAVYYAGATQAARSSAPRPGAAGPSIELAAEDVEPRAIVEQMPERKLLEVTHFHLFTIPICVLVIAHLWMLVKAPSWAHTVGVAAAVVTSGLHVAAPWIVRGRASLAILLPVSGAAMLATLGVLGLGAMIDMWLPVPKPPPGPTMAEKLAAMRKAKDAAP